MALICRTPQDGIRSNFVELQIEKLFILRLTIKARNTNENSPEQRVWITVTYKAPTHVDSASSRRNITGNWEVYNQLLDKRSY